MGKKYREEVHKGDGYQVRILNIPEDQSEEDQKELKKKEEGVVKTLGGERANFKQPKIT